MNIPFSKVSLKGNEAKYIKEVLESGWLTTASKAVKLEQLFADYIGVKYACAVNSCTSALHLAIESAGIKPDDQVLVPALTFTATAEVVRYMGADPVFLDVEYSTGLLTPELVENALKTHKIKALILVHYGGQAPILTTPQGTGIIDICHKNGVLVVEDAAHAFPTKYNDKYIGTFGDITCFSFYANKTITTGEGGMLVTNDEKIYKQVKIMRLHGIDRDVWDRFTSKTPSWEYDVVAPGFKYNMPDINAAIGIAQLEMAEYYRKQRQRCAEYYFKELAGLSTVDLPVCKGSFEDHSWHLYPIIIRPEATISRDDFIIQMANKGIGTSVHYKPLYRMTYYKETYNLKSDDFPNTEKIWKGTVSLPIYPDLCNDELAFICQTIKEILGAEYKVPRIYLSPPHMGGNEQKYVKEAFDTNWVAPLGVNVTEFEKELVRYTKAKHIACLSSGTSSIHLALIVLGVKAGDEVIASSFTFIATINPIIYQGAIPILVDSEPDTWNINPEALEAAIIDRLSKGKRPKAIIAVHLYGMPAKIDEIMEISNRYSIPVIEDSAEALGSQYNGKALGTFGILGILSFNGNKIITTSGGGALISNDWELINRSQFLATQARDDAPHYQHSTIGFNYRISNIAAGIGRGQLEVIEQRVAQRRANFTFYKSILGSYKGISFQEEPDSRFFSNRWLTAIIIDPDIYNGLDREKVRLALEAKNIESRPLWKPMHLQPVFADCPYYGNGISEKLFSNGLCLPSGSNLSECELERVKDALITTFKRR